MIYDSETEMNNVIGEFDKNSFVLQKQNELRAFREQVETIKSKFTNAQRNKTLTFKG